MPWQYTMLKDAPYVVIPVFKCKELNGKYVSKLNPFFTIWCVIENIFLAATAEGLGLDDTELHDCKYYPRDMAHFC